MKWIWRKRLLRIFFIRQFFYFLKRTHVQRDGVSWYRFLSLLFKNISKHEIFSRANGVAFNFTLAIFPAVIFLFTLIPYVRRVFPLINKRAIMTFLKQMMPKSMYDVISSTVWDIISIHRGGLLTFGFLFSVFLATNGMMSLMSAFNACYRTVERRNIFRMRATATGLTFIMAVSIIIAIALLIIGKISLTYITEHISEFSHLSLDKFTIYMLLSLRFTIIFALFFIVISCIYYFGPALHTRWKFFSAGSIFSTLGVLGVCYGFSYYITNFGTYNKVYGSIGALIALMIWIQLITVVLLLGYEINATLHFSHHRKKV